MVKSMVNSCLPEFSDFTRVFFFSPVKLKVLCNRPQKELSSNYKTNDTDTVISSVEIHEGRY